MWRRKCARHVYLYLFIFIFISIYIYIFIQYNNANRVETQYSFYLDHVNYVNI